MENEVQNQSAVKEISEEAGKRVYPEKIYTFNTQLGKAVQSGEIKDIDEILSNNLKMLEPQIVDFLLPNLQSDFLYVGQSKGKLGGGKRRIVRNTQKVTAKAKRQHFSAMAVVGDGNGHIGIGKGRGLESVVAKEKALKTAKLNLIKIPRGCGSWECACHGSHSIPFKVSGKCGSTIVTLFPAPKGISFCVMDDIKTIMRLAGIKDVWSMVQGQTNTRINVGYAAFAALKSLNYYRFFDKEKQNLGING